MAVKEVTENGTIAREDANAYEAATADDTPKAIRRITKNMWMQGGKPKERVVYVPELDGHVLVRALTGGEQDRLAKMERTVVDMDDRKMETIRENQRADVLSWCVMDVETREPLFSKAEVLNTNSKDAAILTRLYAVILGLSRVDQDEIDEIVNGFPKTPKNN